MPTTTTGTPVTVPGVPRSLSATPSYAATRDLHIANGIQIALNWTAPLSDGGSPIIAYEVSSDGGTNWVDIGNVMTHTFSGLSSGTHNIRVRARNAVGVSGNASANPALANPIYINSVAELAAIVNNLSGFYLVDGNIGSIEDPVLSMIAGDFAGTFDGRGHTIHIALTGTNRRGLFETLRRGTVRNLNVTGSITASGNILAIGGIAAVIHSDGGTVDNCHVDLEINVPSSTNTAGPVGGIVGGVTGLTGSFVRNSSARGTINAQSMFVGGIVGNNAASPTIENCQALQTSIQRPNLGTTVGRITATGGNNVRNNSAYAGMLVNGVVIDADHPEFNLAVHNDRHGESIPMP